MRFRLSRRSLLWSGATVVGGAVAGLGLRDRLIGPASNPIGPLRTVADQTTGQMLIKLPEGFEYFTGNWRGEAMLDGRPNPGLPDGMGAFFDQAANRITLMCNHEVPPVGETLFAGPNYDPAGGGGVTRSYFDLNTRRFSTPEGVLSGTLMNCGGGIAPGNVWLSCEETLDGALDSRSHDAHGFVFAVSTEGDASGRPIEAMGRFNHEAVCFDAANGVYYLTEDEDESGMYRYLPDSDATPYAGGRLEMLAVEGGSTSMTRRFDEGPYPTHWVPIDDPTDIGASRRGVFEQGRARGGAVFKRLEGCWSDKGQIHFASTTGGWRGTGQIWGFDPTDERLHLLYESPSPGALDAPDNLTAFNGGLLICENGRAPARLMCLAPSGQLFPVAENAIVLPAANGVVTDYRYGEWTGINAVGDWVFVNIQVPGVTFAIRGPWQDYAAA